MSNFCPKSLYRLSHRFLLTLLAFLFLVSIETTAHSQCVSLTNNNSAYTQNFDTLSNTNGTTFGSTVNNLNFAIPGWVIDESGGGTRDNDRYAVNDGGSSTGDTYSYGAAGETDRALGGLRTGTLVPLFGACFINNTGVILSRLSISYTGEQWRLGSASRTDQINFEYSTDATMLMDGTWTGVSALNFATPNTTGTGMKNGNEAANRTALSSTITGIGIRVGATFWIRWMDADASGSDDGLAVDDFSLTPIGTTAASVTVSGRVITADGRGIRNVLVKLVNDSGEMRIVPTTTFGYFNFRDVPAGQTYVLSAFAKKYRFIQPTQILSVVGDMPELIFIAED